MTDKKLGICMPWDSESLRQRFKTMGICFCYLRSAYPNRRQLASVTFRRWDNYVDWLSGTDVWSMADKSADGQIKETATMNIVTDFDLVIRKKLADLMNESIAWNSATKAARGDDRLVMLNFLSPMISVAEKGNLAVSAPGIPHPGGPA